jgi:hypothetical protein
MVSGPTSFASLARSDASAPGGYTGAGASGGDVDALVAPELIVEALLDADDTTSGGGSSTDVMLEGATGAFAVVRVAGS